MRVAVCNVATGGYRRGQDRLRQSLEEQRCPVEFVSWTDEMPPGSPPHGNGDGEVPYAFKLHALAEARRRGFDVGIWMDCSVWAIRPLEPILAIVEDQGYCLWDEGGWSIGQWCTDAGLIQLGITRDEALQIPLTLSKVVALNFNHPTAAELLQSWHRHATDGVSFRGPWRNDSGEASSDPRALGHRHDMPSLAFHAQRLKMRHLANNDMFEFWSETPSSTTILLCKGL